MSKRRNILITSAGRRVALVRIFQQELSAYIPKAAVFASDAEPELSAACRVSRRSFRLPRLSEPSYLAELLRLCEEQDVGLVVPTIDTELLLLASAGRQFAEIGCTLLVSESELVARCRDKGLTQRLFSDCGVQVPAEIDRAALRFPLFVKPRSGSSGKGAMLVDDPSKMSAAILNDQSLMFFEAVDRTSFDEYTIDMYYDRNSVLRCAVPRKRIEVRAGEISKGTTERGAVSEFVCRHFERLPGARGCITMQLFKHRERSEFLGIEINARFGGGYPLSQRAGANFPAWIIEEYFFDKDVGWFDAWESNLLMLRFDEEIFVRKH